MASYLHNKIKDSNLYHKIIEDFIPIVHHYDKNTVITRNGNLIQTIKIQSIDSTEISRSLDQLKSILRKAILSKDESRNFAFWIHTIHDTRNLEDNLEYDNFFADNIHKIWREKNSWNDRFVNNLYISIVHTNSPKKHSKFSQFLDSLFANKIFNFEDEFFTESCKKLHNYTNLLIEDLKEFHAKKLKIENDDENVFSEIIEFYKMLLYSNTDEKLPLPISDISELLTEGYFSLGINKMEIVTHKNKNFISVLNLKEYHESQNSSIDEFLQLPAKFFVTEIFYFIGQKHMQKDFVGEHYVLTSSGDLELLSIKNMDKILSKNQHDSKFCARQIFCTVIADSIEKLEKNITLVSNGLSKMGLVHFREDINLETSLWSQLPGNFSFIPKYEKILSENICAFSLLHNVPTGHKNGLWGSSVTLFKTEYSTPYFVNFNDKDLKTSTCIFGANRSGKTTLLNFLISESTKFNPTILYFTDDLSSSIFIKSMEGRWFEREKELIDPFLYCKDSQDYCDFIVEFFHIISNHYFNPLSDASLDIVKKLSNEIPLLDKEKRILSDIIENIIPKHENSEELYSRLGKYTKDGKYYKVFERSTELDLKQGDIVAFNLSYFDQITYESEHILEKSENKAAFDEAMNDRRNIKSAIMFAMHQFLINKISGPKILAFDNLTRLFKIKTFSKLINTISNNLQKNNGVTISTVNLDRLSVLFSEEHNRIWLDNINTSFILPSEIGIPGIDKMLHLDDAAMKELGRLSMSKRTFLIQQDGQNIPAELAIANFLALTKLLSCSKTEIKEYIDVILELNSSDPLEWLPVLYKKLNQETE